MPQFFEVDNDISTCEILDGSYSRAGSRSADRNVGQDKGASSVSRPGVHNTECIDLQPISPSLTTIVDPLCALNQETNEFIKHQSVIDAEESGIIPDVIRTMTSELEEENVLQNLKCVERNTQFNKIVHLVTIDPEMHTPVSQFLCDSDDLVFIYDVSEDNMKTWFIKKEGLAESEMKVLKNIRDLQPINRLKYPKMHEEITKQLEIVVAAIQYYLD